MLIRLSEHAQTLDGSQWTHGCPVRFASSGAETAVLEAKSAEPTERPMWSGSEGEDLSRATQAWGSEIAASGAKEPNGFGGIAGEIARWTANFARRQVAHVPPQCGGAQ